MLEVSAVVLAGGRSRRLGRNKAVEPVAGEPLIHRVLGRLSQVAEEAVVVVADLSQAVNLSLPEGARVVADAYPEGGSLGGIFTGLAASRAPWAVVAACDMPFLNVGLLGHLLSLREGYDAVVPVLDGHIEPTHAAYRKACLPHMEARLKAGELKIALFMDRVRVHYVPQEQIEAHDPRHLSFFNINTQQDLERAAALAAEGW